MDIILLYYNYDYFIDVLFNSRGKKNKDYTKNSRQDKHVFDSLLKWYDSRKINHQ